MVLFSTASSCSLFSFFLCFFFYFLAETFAYSFSLLFPFPETSTFFGGEESVSTRGYFGFLFPFSSFAAYPFLQLFPSSFSSLSVVLAAEIVSLSHLMLLMGFFFFFSFSFE